MFVTLSRVNYFSDHHEILYTYFYEYGHERRILFKQKAILIKNEPFSVAFIVIIIYCIIESSIRDWHVMFNNKVFELSLETIKFSSQLLASRVSFDTDSYNTLRRT